jgi:hypothetical protein
MKRVLWPTVLNRLHNLKMKRLTKRFRNAADTTLLFEGVILPLYDNIVKNCVKLNRQKEAPYATIQRSNEGSKNK